MPDKLEITKAEIEEIFLKLKNDADSSGYNLNNDIDFTRDLIKGLLINDNRYGYWACPCRLSYGEKFEDLDIICPCDYRDDDLNEFGSCYCALYVSKQVFNGEKNAESIPDRRPKREERSQIKGKKNSGKFFSNSLPVWRCRVCGYLCARNEPPELCPICKAKKDRFEQFTL